MELYFLIWLAVWSVAAFILYGADKSKAKRGAWRIPEKVLLLSGFLGGAAGAIAGMELFRHKTKAEHWYFRAVNYLGIAWQITLLVYLIANPNL